MIFQVGIENNIGLSFIEFQFMTSNIHLYGELLRCIEDDGTRVGCNRLFTRETMDMIGWNDGEEHPAGRRPCKVLSLHKRKECRNQRRSVAS